MKLLSDCQANKIVKIENWTTNGKWFNKLEIFSTAIYGHDSYKQFISQFLDLEEIIKKSCQYLSKK